MHSIHKLADEIFKAPSQEDLKERAKEFYDALLDVGKEIAAKHSSAKDGEAILTAFDSGHFLHGFLTFKFKGKLHTIELVNFLEKDINGFFKELANSCAANVKELKMQIWRWTKTKTNGFNFPLEKLSLHDAFYRVQQLIWRLAGNLNLRRDFAETLEAIKTASKLADEIFKGPSDEDLIKRALERIHFINFDRKSGSSTEMQTLFPNGAYHVTYYFQNTFPKFHNYFTEKVEKWNEYKMKHDTSNYIWEKAKLNGKTIIRLSKSNRAPLSYWFEKGIL